MRVVALLVLGVALQGCPLRCPEIRPITLREPVEVHVPVLVKAKPPVELTTPTVSEDPTFVAPTDPEATSGLTAEGERRLRAYVVELKSRLRAWEAWARE